MNIWELKKKLYFDHKSEPQEKRKRNVNFSMTFSSFSVRIFALSFIFYFKILLFVVMREKLFYRKGFRAKKL